MTVSLFVAGEPEPKGSTKQMRSGAVMNGSSWDADKRMRAWLAKAATAASGHARITGAVRVTLLFVLSRPPTVKRELPSVKPDLDKLVRCIFDALEKARVIEQDSRIVSLVADKVYQNARSLDASVHKVGVHVTVEAKP